MAITVTTKGQKPVSEKLEGAAITLNYLQRRMNAYPVTENEIGDLGHYSEQNTLFFSLATFFLGLACEVLLHTAFSHEVTASAVGQWLAKDGLIVLIALSIGFAIAGWRAKRRGLAAWEVIKSESTSRESAQRP